MNEFQTLHGLINNVPIKTVQTDNFVHDMSTLIYKIKEQKTRMTAANIFFMETMNGPSTFTIFKCHVVENKLI